MQLTVDGNFHPRLVEFTGAEFVDTEGQLWGLSVRGFWYTWGLLEPISCGYREMNVFAMSSDFYWGDAFNIKKITVALKES